MRKFISVLLLLCLTIGVFAACEKADGATAVTEPTGESHSQKESETAHTDGLVIEIDPAPEVFSSLPEMISAIKEADGGTDDIMNLDAIEYFYAPAKPIEGQELLCIEVLEWIVTYYYMPVGSAEPFNYDEGLTVTYRRSDRMTEGYTLGEMAERYGMEITDDGLLYDPERNEIVFSAGDSTMHITVPDSMNEYELLKGYCYAEKITVE